MTLSLFTHWHRIIPGTLLLLAAGAAQSGPNDTVERLIVKYRDHDLNQSGSGTRRQTQAMRGGVGLKHLRVLANGAELLQLPEAMPEQDAANIAAAMQSDPEVEYAEPDRRRYPADTVPNDARYVEQWSLFEDTGGMRLPAAWDTTTGRPGGVVAVLDSGYRPHSEYDARILSGYDFISADSDGSFFTANDGNGRDNDARDPGNSITQSEVNAHPAMNCVVSEESSWHGTYITGVIAARGNNGQGIAGINWRTRILPVRVLGKCGGFTSDIVEAMYWAAGLPVNNVPRNSTPARVINLSFAGEQSCTRSEQAAINAVTAEGVVVVVAAGNASADVSGYSPASCSGVITVAATTRAGGLTHYTNSGNNVTLSAPGGDGDGNAANYLLVTSNSGQTTPGSETYDSISGTSFSAAAVSGVVSLMLSVRPELSPANVRTLLQTSARPFPDSSCTTSLCGAGIVDATAALQLAQSYIIPVPKSSGGGGGGGIDVFSMLALLGACCYRFVRKPYQQRQTAPHRAE